MLQSVGMSSYEALAAATANAGRFVSTFAPGATPFGTVSVCARADLLIVAPIAVVRLGRVYSAAQLDSIRLAT